MRYAFTIGIIVLVFSGLRSQYLNPNEYPLVTEPEISLKTIDHNSEGFLVTWDTVVYHFFRFDPGTTGNHTGNNAKVVMRLSYDNGATWTPLQVIYDSPFDDRNVHGGITENGRIIVNFAEYDAFTQTQIGYYFIYSDDFGVTWNGPILVNTVAVTSGTHQIFGNNMMGYYNIIYNHRYCEMRHSWDGINWDSIVYVWDFRFLNTQYRISEASFAYLGNGVIIGLFRNDSGVLGENFYQVESYDYGQTWTDLRLTNIADGLFCPSPWIFYDVEHNHVWIIAIDRRGIFLQYNHAHSLIWLYKMYPDEILGNPTEYTPFLTFQRPKPSFYRIYGYPASVKTSDGNYLVIFTESEYRNKGEWAYLYQFKIIYQINPPLTSATNYQTPFSMQLFPNPASEEIYLFGNVSITGQPLNIYVFNNLGQLVLSKTYTNLTDKKFYERLLVSELTSGIYRCVITIGEETKTVSFIKK